MSVKSYELSNMELSNVSPTKGPETYVEQVTKQEDADRDDLIRLGKKPVLMRNFGFLSILGFSCTVLITWEGSLSLFAQGLTNGGPAGIIYGFLLVWVGNLSVFSCLSELASMAPTSGGQYHWVAMLAPRSCAKFLSYVTGWLMVGGWQGSVATSIYIGSSMTQSLAILNNASYVPEPWHATLIFWAIIFVCIFVNVWVSSVLAKFEGFILFLHLLGFFAILIPMIILSDHSDASTTFTTFLNEGGWSSQGLSFFVGLVGNAFAFVGVDGAFHMSEEVRNPSLKVPHSTMLSLIINGSLGFAMMIAVLFCMGDPMVLIKTNYGFPFIQLFYNMTGTAAGATGLTFIMYILGTCGAVGLFASTSRVFWSFARDRGLPGWRKLSQLHPKTSIPIWAVGCTAIVSCLLSLINLGSSVAFNNVVSLGISGLYSSYLMAAGLLLYRRCTGGFRIPDPSALPALANTTGAELIWGPWHVPGVFGIINNIVACLFLMLILIFSYFPPSANPNYQSMNYSILMTGGVGIFAVLYYLVWAKREYQGPIVETES